MSVQRWIHCGLCSRLMLNQETKFYHLSCTDVLCRACMAKTNRGTSCPICNSSVRHFTELGESMGRREKILYHPSPASFYQLASQTLIFQQKHRLHLVQSILKTRASLRRLDELEAQIRQRVAETHQRYENMRRFRRTLQENMRKTIVSGERRSGAAGTLCPVALGTTSQRRMSTCTPSLRPVPVTPVQSQRRFSIDAFYMVDSVKMSQGNNSNDSGIGVTPSSDGSFVGSGCPLSSSSPKKISPMPAIDIAHRRMSVGVGALPMNFTPFKAPRRYSTDSFNQLMSGQNSHGISGMSNPGGTGGTLASSLFIRPKPVTTVSEFYTNNKK
ncbi:RING finger protein vilya-like [Anopheles marshallii]|uniref:RING finger protein vilya-like n=1 Tax=Anopheles marshallii TaxID=1521116 RepID=UPI00237B7CA1|nr:RING finger protein vilya-like [Anopheles marshallii]